MFYREFLWLLIVLTQQPESGGRGEENWEEKGSSVLLLQFFLLNQFYRLLPQYALLRKLHYQDIDSPAVSL